MTLATNCLCKQKDWWSLESMAVGWVGASEAAAAITCASAVCLL